METHEITATPATSWPGFLPSWLRRPAPDQPPRQDAAPANSRERREAIEEYLSTWPPRVFPGL